MKKKHKQMLELEVRRSKGGTFMCGSCGAEYRDVTDAVTHATKMHLAGRVEKILKPRSGEA